MCNLMGGRGLELFMDGRVLVKKVAGEVVRIYSPFEVDRRAV